ncbi:TetR/AcrR family transcriptional regulator [Cohnella fermenti]|uniref:TetR family transcriptional regulator n=1 Tax=Cohnella fermenti TaxID=2565925 RepID=A0A4S4BM55_9BACL|nr:TetR/AcrR family transcriptional regulator [Cohnella fermenti]THF75327.1 TetR family transcriptional regulator [Cohnella fermenti]
MMATTGQDDLRIQRTRQLLHDALVLLLQEKPFYKISVNELAMRAGINRVTFYLHYKNIDEFIERFLEGYVVKIKEVLLRYYDQALPREAREKRIFEHLLTYIQHNKTVYRLLFVQKALPQFDKRVMESLRSPSADHMHEYRQSVSDYEMPREVVSWYAISAMIGTITFWLEQDLPYSPNYLADKIVRLNPLRNLL